jgi:uncharacterized membrane protein YraQ (UPF0718 family)
MLQGTYTLRIIENFVTLFINILPYLVISILLNAVVVKVFNRKKISFSARNEYVAIIIASAIGLLSPLPTYAAIPIGLSLLSAGIPFSAILAFIISSPLMNPSIFFLTATQMGMEMAVVRTVTAFLLGTTSGLLSKLVFRSLSKHIKTPEAYKPRPDRPFRIEVYRNSLYVFKYFSFAIFLSSAVKALVPPELITRSLGGNAQVSTLVAMGLGVPFYTCGGAAIPFIKTLMDMGMSKGATLAFFTVGPATKVETLYAFNRMLGVKILIYYLSLTVIFSYSAGLIYSLF